ncbi:hypothetical protein [Streptomyces sparsogenes]|uniref:Uncharacterized protein n=1 Tax=Streptomyces sparsogenes DSM 40356 TaxID=1331668 RepID=A0A1R1S7U4_9ACTN|nr:hypothetical protein [Streptomyces sparsogenes]OMI34395.1 hypothetical protein SPAR_36466 [Streptomyces sparsogenes DSM 40356]
MTEDDDAPVQPASTSLPIVTATDGQPYLGCDAVLALLRAIAESCRNLASEPDCGLESAAAAIDYEADALECHWSRNVSEIDAWLTIARTEVMICSDS